MQDLQELRGNGYGVVAGETPQRFVRVCFLARVGDIQEYNGVSYLAKKLIWDDPINYVLYERVVAVCSVPMP